MRNLMKPSEFRERISFQGWGVLPFVFEEFGDRL